MSTPEDQFNKENCKSSLKYIMDLLDRFRLESPMNILNFITYPEIANLYFSYERLNAFFNFEEKNISMSIAKSSIIYIIQFFERLRLQTSMNIMTLFNYTDITNLYIATVRINTYVDRLQADHIENSKVNNLSTQLTDLNIAETNIHTI